MSLISIKNFFLYFILNLIISFFFAEVFLRYIYTPKLLSDRILLNKYATDSGLIEAEVFDYENLRYKANSLRPMKQFEYAINYKHDQLGFRNPCYEELNKNLEEIIVGDSFVYGQGLNDPFTYNCLLIKNGISIYTAGLPGASVENYITILKKNIGHVRKQFPNIKRLNLFLFLGNDFESLIKLGKEKEKENENENSNLKSKISSKNEALKTKEKINNKKNIATNEKKIDNWNIGEKESKFNIYLRDINRLIVKTPIINQSYTITSLKLIVKPFIHSNDKGDYVKTHAGSTLYKSSVKLPESEIEKSLNFIIKEISQLDLSLSKIILIEDPVVIDNERFLRDISLANFNPDLINLRHKISSILSVCEKLFLNCIDTSNILKADDFFFADNHLNENGSQNLIKYLSSNFR